MFVLQSPKFEKLEIQIYHKDTVEPRLTATSLQRPFFLFPADKKSIHRLLFKNSLLLQRPLSCPQGSTV